MKIIVVSNPAAVENEANIVNALFDDGLELFHIRKPDYSKIELVELIEKVNAKHHSKIVLHQHHQLVEKFKINRIHFSESARLKLKEEVFVNIKTKGFRLSTSIHELSALNLLSDAFEYTFYGPAFESISKPGYKPKSKEIILPDNRRIKIVAIGGITPNRISELEKLNFDGVAFLGAIWADSKNAINIFRECSQNVNM